MCCFYHHLYIHTVGVFVCFECFVFVHVICCVVWFVVCFVWFFSSLQVARDSICLDTVRVILGVPLLSSCFLHYGLHHLLCILVISVHRLYV